MEPEVKKTLRQLEWVFFASGFAALLYQMMWQRTLFVIYGINIESVTMIVTTFMVGLGAGSLVGGIVSKDPNRPVALLFAIAEAGIGLYGLFSFAIFRAIGSLTMQSSPTVIALATFFMVLVPTTMMGATLPLLSAHFTRVHKSVGESLGALYHMNTLGAAAGALAGGLFIVGYVGQAGTVRVAAALNFVAAAFAFYVHKKSTSKAVAA